MNHTQTGVDTRARLAANLRRRRIARHLSLSQLARSTSTSKATLSGIESGRGNPTIDTLTVLAGALGVSVGELLEEAPIREVHVVRVAEVQPWPPEGEGRRLLEATGRLSGSLEIVEVALPAHHVHESPARADGSWDRALVLQGRLIAGPTERITELSGGDYASFPADGPCQYEAGGAVARALVVRYTPG
ncbi:MAG TPA: XRE family transcriptional regulator [Solirubrobacteraceae bacterium]|nr:XRE family transcriptional regulator [Solirubrobacteraceae bacterium]